MDGLIRHLLKAPNGSRNTTLRWTSRRFGEAIAHGDLDEVTAVNLLVECAKRIQLSDSEIMPTIRSGLERGKANDFSMFDFSRDNSR
jgi:hypothetical protein